MLTDEYFHGLDDHPPPGRMETVPQWARTHEQQLIAVAVWWSIRQRQKRRFPTLEKITAERMQSLPLWCQRWFATLEFEIYWQRSKAAPPVESPSRRKLFEGRREHKTKTKEGSHVGTFA